MALSDFLAELEQLSGAALAAFQAAGDVAALEAARIEFLGMKSGRLKAAQKGFGAVDKADKPQAGQRFNQLKQQIEAALETAQARVAGAAAAAADGPCFDPTLPGIRPRLGHLHPLTQTIEELKDLMGRLGFSAVDGPEVEDEWHNFEALNIPLEHPARNPLDNFYLATASVGEKGSKRAGEKGRKGESLHVATSPILPLSLSPSLPCSPASSSPLTEEHGFLLRSQTSTVQIRVMEKTPPPVRIISLGRVYRPDDADATHYPMFHQIEGLLVDRGITMADLKSVLRLFASSFFQDDVHIRFRPSFFPFTEPSVEVDMSWQGRWIEMGGAGMVDPNVFRAVGYDPEEFTGFAFGLGIERVCMRRHNVTDIREFYKNDVRFLEQFT